MQFTRRLAVLVAPLMIVGGIASAAIPAQAATSSPVKASVATAAHLTSHKIAGVTPDEEYIWLESGLYSSEDECELIGLDEFEDGYAADYECEPEEEVGVCSDDWILWLLVPANLADVAETHVTAEQSQRESVAVRPACG